MCPIETPEGPNIGLIGSLATYRAHQPLRLHRDAVPPRRTRQGDRRSIDYLTADEEENFTIAQANDEFDPETREFGHTDENGNFIKATRVLCRTKDSNGVFGEPDEVPVDAGRLHGRVAAPDGIGRNFAHPVPRARRREPRPHGLEHAAPGRAASAPRRRRLWAPAWSTASRSTPARSSSPRTRASSITSTARPSSSLNNDGDIRRVPDSEVPALQPGQLHQPAPDRAARATRSQAGDVLADGPDLRRRELALGQNLMVAYMPWEGYNYEDAIIVSERVVAEDLLTSIHISEYEIDARDTKLGPEEITREIPNISDDMICRSGRRRHHPHRRRGVSGRRARGQGHPEGRNRAHRRRAPAARHLRREGPRGARHLPARCPTVQADASSASTASPVVEGDELAPGVNELVRIYVAQKRKIQQGDKLSGRHGNKGVISRILPGRGHALPRRRHAHRRHPEPARRSVPYERRPAARDAISVGRRSGVGRMTITPTKLSRDRSTLQRRYSTAQPRRKSRMRSSRRTATSSTSTMPNTASMPATILCRSLPKPARRGSTTDARARSSASPSPSVRATS